MVFYPCLSEHTAPLVQKSMVSEGLKYSIIQIKQCDGSAEICKDQHKDTKQTMAWLMPKLPSTTDGRIPHVEKCFLHTESVFLAHEVC